MLVYVRHGKTALNAPGDGERLRGWLPVPLAPEGRQQASATGLRLAQLLSVDPDSFTASDLLRALQSAGIIGAHLGLTFVPDSRVRDWNTGKYAGTLVKDSLPKLKALIKTPDEPAPDGESLNTYLDRFIPAMREHIESSGVHLVVGHARGSAILEGIADPVGGVGHDINPAFLFAKPNVQPGGILIINNHWGVTTDNPSEKAT